jgi:uncharacterized protein YciI
MFIVLLRFSDNKPAAPQYMAAHNAWIRQGLDDGVFLLAGTIQPGTGALLAHNTTAAELEVRVKTDPFVAEDVVRAEIIEVTPGVADERVSFLLP